MPSSEDSAHFFTAVTYHIAANPVIRRKLFEELKTVMPMRTSTASLQQIEALPYLTAIIHEGLRIAHPVSHRLMRVYPDQALEYHGQTIPAGTTLSMTAVLLHENEDIFPDPKIFRPERFLGPDQKRLLHYLSPFSRGTRSCVGINLAWAQMRLTLASVFRRFDFDLSDVVRVRDVDCVRDHLSHAAAPESKGVIVKVLSVAD